MSIGSTEEPDWMAALARVARGEAFTSFAGQDGAPTAAQWRARQGKDPAFAAVVLALLHLSDPVELEETERRRRMVALAGRWPEQDYAAVVARVAEGESFYALAYKTPGLPSAKAWEAKRELDPELNARLIQAMGRRGRYTIPEADYDAALHAICAGELTADLSAKGLISGATLTRRARRDPAFAKRYRAALASRPRRAALVDSPHRTALGQNDLHSAADRVVARWLPPHAREEIIAELVLAVLEGDLLEEDIPAAAGEFTAEHSAAYASPRMRSMDAPLASEDGRTLHDVLGPW